ncbi:unnamed protein product [Nesidiocoris tenuis]|uniref:Uncharacterized protein n=1 Tax=Nesidiocoris tenuis TaxID=355587 RepID=A0A6H5GUJ9_9HEMI|nr:unnamed protein product [Nesidiocoris tenuis]
MGGQFCAEVGRHWADGEDFMLIGFPYFLTVDPRNRPEFRISGMRKPLVPGPTKNSKLYICLRCPHFCRSPSRCKSQYKGKLQFSLNSLPEECKGEVCSRSRSLYLTIQTCPYYTEGWQAYNTCQLIMLVGKARRMNTNEDSFQSTSREHITCITVLI